MQTRSVCRKVAVLTKAEQLNEEYKKTKDVVQFVRHVRCYAKQINITDNGGIVFLFKDGSTLWVEASNRLFLEEFYRGNFVKNGHVRVTS